MSGSRVRSGKLRTQENEGFSSGSFLALPFPLTHLHPPSSSLLTHQSLLTADFWLHTSEGAEPGHDQGRERRREGSHQSPDFNNTFFHVIEQGYVVGDDPRCTYHTFIFVTHQFLKRYPGSCN